MIGTGFILTNLIMANFHAGVVRRADASRNIGAHRIQIDVSHRRQNRFFTEQKLAFKPSFPEPEILINSVQRSDSSRYGILAQAGTVIHNFEMGVGVGLLVLALPGLLGAFFPH